MPLAGNQTRALLFIGEIVYKSQPIFSVNKNDKKKIKKIVLQSKYDPDLVTLIRL